MTATHTPGPWAASASRTISASPWPFGIAKANVDPDMKNAPGFDEALANARIMAAAPDLLAAATDALADLRHYAATHGPGPDARIAALEAAIAKATGASA